METVQGSGFQAAEEEGRAQGFAGGSEVPWWHSGHSREKGGDSAPEKPPAPAWLGLLLDKPWLRAFFQNLP